MRRRLARSRAARLVLAGVAATAALLSASVISGAAEPSRSGGAAAGAQTFTLYAGAFQNQFVNNHDDRARGKGKNPFGNYAGSLVPTPMNELAFGPFPGDAGIYSFNLYTNATRRTNAGTAIAICQYDFNQNGLCVATFKLDGGSLIGKGAYNFNARRFTLAIIGGTSRYRGSIGKVDVTALGPRTQKQPVRRDVPMLQAQRLSFLTRAAS